MQMLPLFYPYEYDTHTIPKPRCQTSSDYQVTRLPGHPWHRDDLGYTHFRMSVYIYTYIYGHIETQWYTWSVYKYIYVCIHVRMDACIHACMDVCMYVLFIVNNTIKLFTWYVYMGIIYVCSKCIHYCYYYYIYICKTCNIWIISNIESLYIMYNKKQL